MGTRLSGKVCLITGAGSGIGQASARLFASEGGRVVVADLDPGAARATADEIVQAGGQAVAELVDVTDEVQTVDLAARVMERWGRIDVLFNNAGIAGVGDVLETEPALFDRVMKVNVRGVYLMSRAVVPHMIAQKSGSVINMSSNVALMGIPGRDCYTAAKGAVASMTRSMAVEFAPKVRVNAIAPSATMTERVRSASGTRSFPSGATHSECRVPASSVTARSGARPVASSRKAASCADGSWNTPNTGDRLARTARSSSSRSRNGPGSVPSCGTIDPPYGSSSTSTMTPRTRRSEPRPRNRISYG